MPCNWWKSFGRCLIVFSAIILYLIYIADQTVAKTNDQDQSDPNNLVPGSGQYCEGCYATIDILIQEVSKSNIDLKGPYRMKEKWEEFKQNLCDTSNLTKYVYSPPKMTKVGIYITPNKNDRLK